MHGENLLWRWIQQLFRNARVPEGCRGQLLDKLLPKLSLDDLELDWNGGLFLVPPARTSHTNKAFQSRAFPDISANGANYVVAVCEQTCSCSFVFTDFRSIHRSMVNSSPPPERRVPLRSLERSSR